MEKGQINVSWGRVSFHLPPPRRQGRPHAKRTRTLTSRSFANRTTAKRTNKARPSFESLRITLVWLIWILRIHTTLMTAPSGRPSASRLLTASRLIFSRQGFLFITIKSQLFFGTNYFTTGFHFITICRLIFRPSQFFLSSFFFHMGGHMKKSSFSLFRISFHRFAKSGEIG